MNDKPVDVPKKGKRKQKEQQLTTKQEGLAQALAAGEHFLPAFKANYNTSGMDDKTTYKKANWFANQPKIQARVAELRRKIKLMEEAHFSGAAPLNLPKVITDSFTKETKIVSEVIINRQTLTHMLLQDRALARELGQAAAAIAGLKELGKLHQLTTDGREGDRATDLEKMTPEQLKAVIRSEFANLGRVTMVDMDDILELVDMRPITDTPQ